MPVIHLLALIALSCALFVPIMGRGFLFDDFGHLFVAGYESFRWALTHATGGPYYAPLAYLSFKLDWILWGPQPFAFAATNLIIHIVNTLLLYALVLRLWGSTMGAWWAALGLAVLFRANVYGIMNIAARAHILVAMFYLATLHAALWFARTDRWRLRAALATLSFATLMIFTKESGLTVSAAIGVLLAHQAASKALRAPLFSIAALFGMLALVSLLYLGLRVGSGATPVSFTGPRCCSYVLSPILLGNNLLFYARWTYALLALLGLAVALSLLLRGVRPRFSNSAGLDVLLSAALFAVATAPFILIDWRTEAYGYLAGVSAALLLGALTAGFYQNPPPRSVLTLAPVVCVVALYAAFTLADSGKWLRMAETNAMILKSIRARQPTVAPKTFIALTHTEADLVNRFPEGFQEYSFPYAVRVLYGDRTLDGRIVRSDEPFDTPRRYPVIRFSYIGGEVPQVIKQTAAGGSW